jgi:hypothetical protein
MRAFLSGVREPEREAASGLSESQLKVVREQMASAKRKKAAL